MSLDPASGHLRALPGSLPLPRAAYHPLINRPMFDEAAFALLFVADLRAIAPVYGDRSIHFCTLEAGLMTGLLELQAASTPLGVCQVGELDEPAVARALCLGPAQRLVHSLVGGLLEPDRAAATRAAGLADLRPEARFARLLERVTVRCQMDRRASCEPGNEPSRISPAHTISAPTADPSAGRAGACAAACLGGRPAHC